MQVRQEEEDVDKKGIAVGALALVAGLLVSLQVEGVQLGLLVITAPVWGGVIVALVGATVREVSVVGGALDEPTQAGEVAGAAWAAASRMKGRRDGREDFVGCGVRFRAGVAVGD